MINQAACQEILWVCDRDVKISLVKKREFYMGAWAPTSKESHGRPKIYCWMRVPLACKWGGIIVEKADSRQNSEV